MSRLATAGLLAVWLAAAAAAPLLTTDPLAVGAGVRLQAPSMRHPFGTDQFGRDVAARVAAGARYALFAVVVSTVVAGAGGCALGLVSGYAGGVVDAWLSRVIDLWLALPSLLFAIAIAGAIGTSFENAVLAIGFMRIPSFARVARAAALSLREAPYVLGARTVGASGLRVLVRHVLPNAAAPLIALASTRAATALQAGTALSFVGLGAPVPAPEWGSLVAAGRPYLAEAWWVSGFPCAAVVAVAFALQLAGDEIGRRAAGQRGDPHDYPDLRPR